MWKIESIFGRKTRNHLPFKRLMCGANGNNKNKRMIISKKMELVINVKKKKKKNMDRICRPKTTTC